MLDEQLAGQVVSAARASDIEPAGLLAVVEIESAGRALEEDNSTPRLLFERHVFYRELNKRAPGQLQAAVAQGLAHDGWRPKTQYQDQRTSAQRLELLARARAVDVECADCSCSWGLGQTMGFLAEELAFPNAVAMLSYMTTGGVPAQLELMIKEIKRKKILDALNHHDWRTFARSYNGPGYEQNQYHTKLANAYARWASHLPSAVPLAPLPGPSPVPAPVPHLSGLAEGAEGEQVVQLQRALQQRHYAVGEVDGEFGPNTREAVRAFQRNNHLLATGVVDAATLRALGVGEHAPIIDAGLKPENVLHVLFQELLKKRATPTTPGAPAPGQDPLQLIVAALLGRQPASGPVAAPGGAPPVRVLSFIDKVLGGEAMTGKKTALSIVAYAVMAILKAAGVVSAVTPGGQIVSIIIAAFGGLGGIAKIDRVIQTLGIIAAKAPPPAFPGRPPTLG